MVKDFTPMWKTPTRSQAIDVLRTCRAWTDGIVGDLSPHERSLATPLGDGTWSVKDLLGHLATHEHRALITIGARQPGSDDELVFADVHALNAHHLREKRAQTLDEVEADYAATRTELVAAIDEMSDERWLDKIAYGRGRSALGLVLGKMLNGDKYGYFAHDLAHRRGLEHAVEVVRATRS